MTGGMPISYSVDHCGPICSSTENVARLLAAIAGPDLMDPRTTIARTQDYMGALGEGVGAAHCGPEGGLRTRGQRPRHERQGPGGDRRAEGARRRGRGGFGALHYDGPHIWTAIILEGAAEMMIKGYALGNNWPGYYATSLVDAFARGFHTRLDDASETVKLVLLLGEYMHRQYHGRYTPRDRTCAGCCAMRTTGCCATTI